MAPQSCSTVRSTRRRCAATCATSPGSTAGSAASTSAVARFASWPGSLAAACDLGARRRDGCRRHPARPASHVGRLAGGLGDGARHPARGAGRGEGPAPELEQTPGLTLALGDGGALPFDDRALRHRPLEPGAPPPRSARRGRVPARAGARRPPRRGRERPLARHAPLASARSRSGAVAPATPTRATTRRSRSGARTRCPRWSDCCTRRASSRGGSCAGSSDTATP